MRNASSSRCRSGRLGRSTKSTMIVPPRLRRRTCRAISAAASRSTSSGARPPPSTSIATQAAVGSISSRPPRRQAAPPGQRLLQLRVDAGLREGRARPGRDAAGPWRQGRAPSARSRSSSMSRPAVGDLEPRRAEIDQRRAAAARAGSRRSGSRPGLAPRAVASSRRHRASQPLALRPAAPRPAASRHGGAARAARRGTAPGRARATPRPARRPACAAARRLAHRAVDQRVAEQLDVAGDPRTLVARRPRARPARSAAGPPAPAGGSAGARRLPAAARASLATRSAGCGRPQSRKAALSLASTAVTRPTNKASVTAGIVAVDVADLDQPIVDQHGGADAEAGILDHDARASRRASSPGPASRASVSTSGRPDDVGVGAVDRRDQRGGQALDGIAAGLALPFAAGEIGVDLAVGQALELRPSS